MIRVRKDQNIIRSTVVIACIVTNKSKFKEETKMNPLLAAIIKVNLKYQVNQVKVI
jgi:hypothetical protein